MTDQDEKLRDSTVSARNGECPKPRPDGFTKSHLMRLDDVLDGGEREVWRCAQCGLVDVVTADMRCFACGGRRDEPAPNWCKETGSHGN